MASATIGMPILDRHQSMRRRGRSSLASGRRLSGMALAGLCLLSCFLFTGMADPRPAVAQDSAAVDGTGAPLLDAEALKVLVAPVALYPDDVLAVLLPAATTGLQIVQAQQYLDRYKSNNALKPNPDWDPSILALLNYPDVVARLNADLDWTQRLGDAVVNQQGDVMDAIQQIRNEAVAAGYLKTNANTVVTQTAQTVVIAPANPEVIYVPNYDPQVIVQQTYISAPPPVYYNPYRPYYSPAATFFTGVVVGTAMAYAFDWIHHDIDVDVHYGDHHGNDHHDNDHNNGGDHHDNGHNNDFGKYNIGRKPGQNGGKITWNGGQKRPAIKPGNRPAPGLAPVNRMPATVNNKFDTHNPNNGSKPNSNNKLNNNNKLNTGNKAITNNKPPAVAPKNTQLQNRVGNSQSTGKATGGFGNITSGNQALKQSQRGSQSLRGQTQRKAPVQQQFNKGSAFSGSGSSGAAVNAQQRRGGGSLGGHSRH